MKKKRPTYRKKMGTFAHFFPTFRENKHIPYFQMIARSLSVFTHTFLFFGVLFDEL